MAAVAPGATSAEADAMVGLESGMVVGMKVVVMVGI